MNFGFIGCGKMATALLQGMLSAKVTEPSAVSVFDVHKPASQTLQQQLGVKVADSNAVAAESADTVLLCVKPQDALTLLSEISESLAGKLLISIAAGLSIEKLQAAAHPTTRIIRVMPNTPALLGKGASAFSAGPNTTEVDLRTASNILSAVGTVSQVEEDLLDAVTGLSGSGPAYVYYLISALAKAGENAGLPSDMALQLSAQTFSGAAEMILQTGKSPQDLIDMVTSPGGTTLAGLKVLENSPAASILNDTVEAAKNRSIELRKS